MKNYLETFSTGRGANGGKAYVIAFEPYIKLEEVDESVRVFSEKSGLSVKYLPAEGQPLSGFIRREDLWDVYDRVTFAKHKLYERELNPAARTEAPYVFRMGNGFKGKTAEQCLLDGMTEQQMLTQRDFMSKNCSGKFAEQNRLGVQAIDKALEKLHNGSLGSQPVMSGSFSIYKAEGRFIPKRGVAEPYQTRGWDLTVSCNIFDDNPWGISWKMSDVVIEDRIIKSASNIVTASAALTTQEFDAALNETRELFSDLSGLYRPAHWKYNHEHRDDWRTGA